MLKILFSPSEGKNNGGSEESKDILGALNARNEIFNQYNEIIFNDNEESIKKLFGIKKFKDCEPYINNVFNSPLMCAIERYQGVAYDYLKYKELPNDSKEYLKNNCIIFSNLYGPIFAGDPIVNYKVKQGNNIGNIIPDKFYKERFTYQLDLLFNNDELLDLRAGYYDKFYKITKPYTTLKFLKNGKVVSHWAKAYRGIILKELAKNTISSIKDFMSLEIEGLNIEEIKIIKNKTEIIYNIN